MRAEADRANAHADYEENWHKVLRVAADAKLGQATFEEPRQKAQEAYRRVMELDKVITQLRKQIKREFWLPAHGIGVITN